MDKEKSEKWRIPVWTWKETAGSNNLKVVILNS